MLVKSETREKEKERWERQTVRQRAAMKHDDQGKRAAAAAAERDRSARRVALLDAT